VPFSAAKESAPKEAAPEAEVSAPQPTKNTSAADLIKDIHSGMTELMQMMSKSKAVAPEDSQQLASIMSSFESFVEGTLTQAPGARPPKAEPPMNPGATPMEAGANPNARPF